MKHQHPTDPNLFWCNKCEKYKELQKFEKKKGCPFGITGRCIECASKKKREWYHDNFQRNRIHINLYYKNKYKNLPENQKNILRQKSRKRMAETPIEIKRHRRKESYKNNKCKIDMQNKIRSREARANLPDWYIRINLRKQGLYITKELIELNRQQLIMKRTLKQFKKWRKDYESNHTNVYGEQFKNEEDHERRLQTRSNFNSPARV